MNPYDFVPVKGGGVQAKSKPKGHERFHLNTKSGIIYCSLLTETPIFIGGKRSVIGNNNNQKPTKINFFTCNQKLAIPGSSLKGMFRSVAETIADSCMVLCDTDYSEKKIKVKYQDTKRFCSCNSEEICLTCNIFGSINKNKKLIHKGKVSYSDALIDNSGFNYTQMEEIPILLSNPKPRHRLFYEKNGRILGRKYYYHQGFKVSNKKNQKMLNHHYSIINPIEKGRFTFEVTFENLTDAEFNLFLYTLVLEDTMRHKIGMGKPLGFGSVQINIEKINLINPQKRYRNYSEKAIEVYQNDKLIQLIANCIQKYTQDRNSDNLKKLRNIWQWPPLEKKFAYPGQWWFNDPENSQISLEEYQKIFVENNSIDNKRDLTIKTKNNKEQVINDAEEKTKKKNYQKENKTSSSGFAIMAEALKNAGFSKSDK